MSQAEPHVAFYLRMLSGGGAERVVVNLAQGFVQKGVKVDLVLNILEGPYLGDIPSEVRIIDLKTPKLLKGLPRLARYLKQEQPQALVSALHYNNEIAILAKYLARVSTKVVVSEHSTLSINAQHKTGSEHWSPFVARLFYPWANEILTVSQGSAQDLAQVTGLPPSRIRVAYNPIVTPQLLAKSQEPLEHPWFQVGEIPVILAVGRLHQVKDYRTLIKAFAKVRKIQPCRLVILGRGPERQKLDGMVQGLGLSNDVALLGFVENPYTYMAKSAVLALSSLSEGLPSVLIEAMALGTSVVSTNCPSGPAEILDNGKYGFLVPVRDSEAMAEAISNVLSGHSKAVNSAWLEQFTLETAIKNYWDILGI